MARRSPRIRLKSADFPTLGRPTMATSGRAISYTLGLSAYAVVALGARVKTEPIIGTVSDGRVVLKENRIMMVSDEMGDIPAGNTSGLGLYFSDTRFLSAYEFRLNRVKPILLSASVDESYVATFQMVNPVLLLDEGKRRIPQQSISIRRSRFIYGGLHERIGLQNCGREPIELECSIRVDNDFRDRGLLRRSQMDLRILLEEFDSGLFPMAGIPWFSAPFGRDALITSIQTLMLNPEIARGTLRYLAQEQGHISDRTRAEEPGKILH